MNTPRSYLFVPATQPERIAKAFASGADAVIVDWEDSVSSEAKPIARAALLAHDTAATTPPVWLRINAADSTEYAADIESARKLKHIHGVFLPKAQSAQEVNQLHQTLNKPVIAIIETAQGMLNIADIAAATGLHALTFGCLDLANELGMRSDSIDAEHIFNRLRTDLLLYSTVHQLSAPIETIYPAFKDHEGLMHFTQRWRNLGFSGMLCIHPAQIAVIHDTLKPSAAELDFARRVHKAYQENAVAAFQIDGKMIDMPVIKAAQILLDRYDNGA